MLLAVDTSTAQIGIALYDGVRVLGETSWTSARRHTVQLAPAAAQVLERAGKSFADLTALGVATGPGSFTALRVGLAFVKGLAIGRGLPIIGVPTLDILAAAQPVQELPLAAALQAGRGRIAVGWYRAENGRWVQDGPAVLMTPAGLSNLIHSPTLLAGEFDEQARTALGRKWKNSRLSTPARSVRRPALLAELAWERLQAGQSDDPAALEPIYLAEVVGE